MDEQKYIVEFLHDEDGPDDWQDTFLTNHLSTRFELNDGKPLPVSLKDAERAIARVIQTRHKLRLKLVV